MDRARVVTSSATVKNAADTGGTEAGVVGGDRRIAMVFRLTFVQMQQICWESAGCCNCVFMFNNWLSFP